MLFQTKLPALVSFSVLLAVNVYSFSQDSMSHDRSDYVSNASHTIASYKPTSFEYSPAKAAAAAKEFLDTLNDEQALKAIHSIDSPERQQWTNLPADPNAGGIRLAECEKGQIEAACKLMAVLFSQQGYEKMRNIMLADDQLLKGGQPRRGFGTENFAIVIFGDPSDSQPWAFQLDGHHVGVNISMNGDKLTMSPSFIGTQPQSFTIGDRKIRPLTGEIDDAFKLVNSLSDDQRKQAVISRRRSQIATGPGLDFRVPKTRGVAVSTFDKSQKEILVGLISEWVNDLPEPYAKQRRKEIESELDKTFFAWNGAIKPGSDISYIIQGPSLIIEYSCQDLGSNHLHSMYRNPKNEYGLQIGENKR